MTTSELLRVSELSVDAAVSRVVLARVMGHADTNLYGSVHGGTVMHLIDEAAAATAARHAGVPALTVRVEGMDFLAPAHVGDLVSARAQLVDVGRTSMRVRAVVTAERWNELGPVVLIATAELMFVAIDGQGRPVEVPRLAPADVEWLAETVTEGAATATFVPRETGQRPRHT
ncbi:acyl-CoA thioesterase [Calidifontibacter sp. DB0510]|uniref:Acyl-CoA thioesterase n=1 Tax=Metallococcus carri TaxID=1656884 RepID=A0A967B007_9MICO|nr:hotdog domain-containing protein [Metallococcus carri]NHN55552.1 acyl-CoA thioesterase [Metallococcus carri]NOP38264.1 acyl-CoA thioesterase [Calidifontibacter sp. DB2511S]